MTPIVDTIHHDGRHVRILATESIADDELLVYSVLVDGRVFSGFASRVEALAAARHILAAG